MERLLDELDQLPFRTLTYAQPKAWRASALHAVIGIRARRLRTLAARHPDLRAAYEAKLADVVQWRGDIVSADATAAAHARITATLDALEARLADGRPFLVGTYSLADVLAIVDLARLRAIGQGAWLTDGRHRHLVQYYERVRARPSFAAAAVWEKVEASERRQIASIVLPFLLPRLAVASIVLAVLVYAARALL
jgi:glutathione S-transferase